MALGWKGQYIRYRQVFLNVLALYRRKEDLRMYLEIILSLAAISLFAVFALRPTFLTIAGLFKEIKTKEETIVKMDAKIQALEKAQVTLAQEQYRLPILTTAIAENPKPAALARQIEGLAQTATVNLSGFVISETLLKGKEPVKKAQNQKEISPLPAGVSGTNFSLSVSGSYPNLILFLEGIEKLRIPVKIDLWSFNLSKNKENQILILTVTGRVPFL